jgi:hypothetical protein
MRIGERLHHSRLGLHSGPRLRRLLLAGLLLGSGDPSAAAAQPAPAQAVPPAQPPAPVSARLRVFLDCDCFAEFLRDQITWVDFVRQPQDAEVHLLSSERETGGGGRELTLRFVGRGRFADVAHDLRVVSQVAEAESLRRDRVLQTVIVGLLNYMARDSLPPGLAVEVESAAAAGQAAAAAAADPWNLWVFGVSTGASVDAEETQRQVQWNVNATADRVTDQWKLAFGFSLDEERETFDFDEDQQLEARRTEREADWFVARGFGPHWSAGFDGQIASSTFGNTQFLAQVAPAVEYSIFPYRDYATRQWVIQYQIGVEHARYSEITVFNKLEESNPRHELSSDVETRQPWGSLEVGIEWSQYLHDLTKYQLELEGEISLRVVRGLSIDLEGSASRVRDQLSLPRRGATPEEILLQLRELQSGYEVSFSVGVSYSFGSIFNNVVNPRFRNRGN